MQLADDLRKSINGALEVEIFSTQTPPQDAAVDVPSYINKVTTMWGGPDYGISLLKRPTEVIVVAGAGVAISLSKPVPNVAPAAAHGPAAVPGPAAAAADPAVPAPADIVRGGEFEHLVGNRHEAPNWKQLVARIAEQLVLDVNASSATVFDEYMPQAAQIHQGLSERYAAFIHGHPAQAQDAGAAAVPAHELQPLIVQLIEADMQLAADLLEPLMRFGPQAVHDLADFGKIRVRSAAQRVIQRYRANTPCLAESLHEYGPRAFLTTNYDTLITDALAGERAAFSFSAFSSSALDKMSVGINDGVRQLLKKAVIHLHGLWTDHDDHNGFTLTSKEYNEINSTVKLTMFLCKLLKKGDRPRRLLFVGAGKTIVDPHFVALWYALGRTPSIGGTTPDSQPHYMLVTGKFNDQIGQPPLPASCPEVWEDCANIFQRFGTVIIPIVATTSYEPQHLASFITTHLTP